MPKIGFIGAGNMAAALINGVLDSNVFGAADVFVSDIDSKRLLELKNRLSINTAVGNIALVAEVDIIVLSVKPQVICSVLAEIKDQIKAGSLIVSIAAGITVGKIEEYLGSVPIVRVMPNTPALVGQGASALYANELAKSKLDSVKQIFDAVGMAVVVENEDLIDTVTAVSGSGPAYYFLLMEKMIAVAIELGLEAETARQLVLQTAKGAAELALVGDDSPAELRKKVTSPGGTTEAALKVFSQEGFDKIIMSAIKQARQRSKELSKM